MSTTAAPNEEMIRAKAHALWLDEGRPDGRAEIHWFQAVQLLNTQAAPVDSAAKPKRKAAARKRG